MLKLIISMTVTLVCLTIEEALGQPASLAIPNVLAAAGDTATVTIDLTNHTAVSGMSWMMTYDGQAMDPVDASTTPRTDAMEIHSHTSRDSLSVLVFDSADGQTIAPGEGAVANVRFRVRDGVPDGAYPLGLHQAAVADTARPPTRVETIGVDGVLSVTGFVASLVASECASGDTIGVAVDLRNPEPVLGLQIQVRWSDPDLAFVAATAGARALRLRPFGASLVQGEATLVLADLSGAFPLNPGEGPVMHLWLHVGREVTPSTVQLDIAQIAASGPGGNALSIVSRNTHLTIMQNVNAPPQLELPELFTAIEDSVFARSIPARDGDGDALTYEALSGPSWIAIDGTTGQVRGTPGDADVGRTILRVRVSDGVDAVEDEIRVEVRNRPPSLSSSAPLRARVGGQYRYAPVVENLDGGHLGLGTRVEGAAIDPSDGALVWQPSNAGETAFTLTATDPNGGQAVQSFVVVVEPRPRIVIDEILADPPPGAGGDANGDGTRDGKQDEFIEILNQGDQTVDIGGWTLSDDDTPPPGRFAFPHGTALDPGARAVLFGGGRPQGVLSPAHTDDGTIGNGLTNAGDLILLLDPAFEDTIATAAYTPDRNQFGSLAWVADGGYASHGAFPGKDPYSPGRARPVVVCLSLVAPDTIRAGDSASVHANAVYTDQAVADVTGEAEWGTDSSHLKIVGEAVIVGVSQGAAALHATWNGIRATRAIDVLRRPNRPPLLEPVAAFSVLEDSSFELQLLASDPDGDSLAYGLTEGPEWVIVGENGVLSGTPRDSDVGQRFVEITVSDDEVEVTGSIEIEVLNRPPVITGEPSLEARVGGLYRYEPTILNLDGGLVGLPFPVQGARVDASTGSLSWRPVKAGEVALALTATDPNGGHVTRSFVVSVAPRPQIVIDEILADPPAGSVGDANGDGTRDGKQDEFVEILNQGARPVDLSGWELSDDDVSAPEHFIFPAGAVLGPGERAVLFGGGNPQGIPGRVYTDDGSIGNGLSNAGDTVLLIDPALEDTVDQTAYSSSADLNQSLIRVSEGWELHGEVPGAGRFSPGRARPEATGPGSIADSGSSSEDDTPLSPDPGPTPSNPEETESPEHSETRSGGVEAPSGVVISEILADPAPGLEGDANGDGVRHGYEDEFIEIWNSADGPADLSGCRLGDDDVECSRLFQFPEGVVLAPGCYLTLFGGGQPEGIPGQVVVDDGRIGDGLANGGDRVLLLSADGADTLASLYYPSGHEGVSWRCLDREIPIGHDRLPGWGPYSPGRSTPTLVSVLVEPDSLRLAIGERGNIRVVGAFADSTRFDLTGRIDLTSVDSTVVRLDRDGSVQGLRAGGTSLLARWKQHADSSWVQVGNGDAPVGGQGGSSDDVGATGAGSVSGTPATDTVQVSSDGGGFEADSSLKIRALPDSLARVGFLYSCPVEVSGESSDRATLRLDENPGWLTLSRDGLVGVPLPGDEGTSHIRLVASDGANADEIRFRITAVEDDDCPLPDSLAYVGLTWRWPFRVQDGLNVETRGGPRTATDGSGFVWRPQAEDEGRRIVTVEVKTGGSSVSARDYGIAVHPRPRLEVTEILMDPPSDANGDGEVGASADEFIELHNTGSLAVDLSGWTLGDDDGKPFSFPAGTIMAPGARFTLFGHSTGDAGAGRFSAGGKIGNGLAASDRVLLICPAGPDTLIDVVYSVGRIGGSLIPDPADPTAWVSHAAIYGAPFSPGYAFTPMEQTDEKPDTSQTDAGESDEVPPKEEPETEADLVLRAPRPNPFNSSTVIGIEVGAGHTRLVIYNILGQPVRRLLNRGIPEGTHQMTWHGRDERGVPVGSGIYLIECRTETQVRTVRAVLLR